ncbi:hypothetical protein VitviT2T_019797 [Vitis vinifera]|uniref:Uncharacterized protein n=1 Tax=Vitis vinifera TaxID=29760 RepID=A0ABY9D457_VITVI|nr:hypothetical protein VitviT2T_019797 [Vitis vinifera]
MASEANYIFSDTKKAEKGYVKGAVTNMVTDALVVKPLSTMSIVDLLNKSNINEVGGFACLNWNYDQSPYKEEKGRLPP